MNTSRKIAKLLLVGAVVFCASAALRAEPAPPGERTSIEAIAREFDLTPQLLSASQPDSGGDPLKAISGLMTGVHGDLSRFLTGQVVQEKEKRVVKSLDELIAAVEKQCQNSGMAQQGNRPGTGRRQSVIASGDPRGGNLHDVAERGPNWNQLPPKERERILQSTTEGFPPGYESLLQSYYQQLAQEKAADDKLAVPPTNPSAP